MTPLEALRDRPGDAALRDVVIDEWLLRGDPRSDLAAAERQGDAAHVRTARQRILDALPGPEPLSVRIIGGFVVEVAWELEGFLSAGIARQVLAWHPLAVARVRLPSLGQRRTTGLLTDEEFQTAFTAFALACGAVRGVWFEDVSVDHWPVVRDWLVLLRPRVLGLQFRQGDAVDPPEPLPSVRDVLLEVPPQRLDDWLAAVPNADRLALRSQLGVTTEISSRPWRELDLRGQPALNLPDIRLRHPHHHLRSASPLDDPFGDRGTMLPAPSVQTVHAAVSLRDANVQDLWLQIRGTRIVESDEEEELRHVEVASPITAVVRAATGIITGHADGTVQHRRDPLDEASTTALVRVPGAVRQLVVHERTEVLGIATTQGHGTLGDRGLSFFTEPVSGIGWLRELDGFVIARGSRLDGLPGSPDLGDTITGLASGEGDGLAVMAGSWVYHFQGGQPSVVGRCNPAAHRIDRAGGAVAWVSGNTVHFVDSDGAAHRLDYPTRYQSDAQPLRVADVALHPDGTLLVVLDPAGANLRVERDVMRIDEPPGASRPRWIFVYDGRVLVAG